MDTIAEAMMEIRRNYEVKKNWMGDPCFPPSYKWEGIRCSYNGDNPPRVISMYIFFITFASLVLAYFIIIIVFSIFHSDLSDSKLNGSISPSIGNLMALTYL